MKVKVNSESSRLRNPQVLGDTLAFLNQVLKPHGGLCRRSPPFLFLDQPLGNDHEIVGQHGSAYQEFEMLSALGQAPLHTATAEENRDAALDTRTKTLSLFKGRTFFLGFPFGRLFSSALGDAGDADSRLVGDFDISFTVETTIRTLDVRRLAESFLVALERGFNLILVGRVSLQDTILGDQPPSTLGQEDFVAELDGLVDLTALDQIGVRFKNRVHLLFGGDLLPLQDTASSLIDNSVTELAVVFDLLAKCPDG